MFVFLAVSPASAIGLQDLRAKLQKTPPGSWVELQSSADGKIPDTHLTRVFPERLGHPAWGTRGPKAVIGSWSGGAFDSDSSRFYVFGGGHRAYGGNEVYVFDLPSLRWIRLTDPSAFHSSKRRMADDTPLSRHTYDGLVWLNDPPRMLVMGGAPWSRSGGFNNSVWTFNPRTLEWKRRRKMPRQANPPFSAFDPVGREVIVLGRKYILGYRPKDDSWRSIGKTAWLSEGSAAMDSTRRRLVVIDKKAVWTCVVERNCNAGLRRLPITGDKFRPSRDYGLVYVPNRDSFLAWKGGAEVWRLNADTMAWTVHRPIDRAAPVARGNTFGRWQYVTALDAMIGVRAANRNVWLYKPLN